MKTARAHSLREVELYCRVAGCARCGGPWERSQKETGERTVVLACGLCGLEFAIEVRSDGMASGMINSSLEASSLIDVGQWLTLSGLLREQAKAEPNRIRARQIGIEAGECLDEALKFYDDPENDLPPQEAFFCESSKLRFKEAPEQFSRERIVGERVRLPKAGNEAARQ